MPHNLNSRVASLERAVKQLEILARALKSQNVGAANQEDHSNQEDNRAEPISPRSTDIIPTPENGQAPSNKWPQAVHGWMLRHVFTFRCFEALGIIAAVILAYLTYLQWSDLRHNFRIEQRAWVKVDGWPDTPGINHVNVQLTVNKSPNYPLRVMNIGKTPASNISGWVFVDILDTDKEVPLAHVDDYTHYPRVKVSNGMLFPTQETLFNVVRPDKKGVLQPITQQEMMAIFNGSAYQATYGIITYDDVFGRRHWTKFCIPTIPPSAIGTNTNTCIQFNATDDP